MANESPIFLDAQEGQLLLQVARQALVEAVQEGREWRPDLTSLPSRLQEPGCSFVTLYTGGSLHGCIGTVVPLRPLALDTAHNAVSAALHDPRFPPLTPDELRERMIESTQTQIEVDEPEEDAMALLMSAEMDRPARDDMDEERMLRALLEAQGPR